MYIYTHIHAYSTCGRPTFRPHPRPPAGDTTWAQGMCMCICASLCARVCVLEHACMHAYMYARLHACITCMCARLDLARNNLIMHACMHACIIPYTRAGEAARQRRQHAAAQLLERLPSELDSIEPQSREDWLDACREALLRSCRPLPPLLRRALAGCDAGRALQGASV